MLFWTQNKNKVGMGDKEYQCAIFEWLEKSSLE